MWRSTVTLACFSCKTGKDLYGELAHSCVILFILIAAATFVIFTSGSVKVKYGRTCIPTLIPVAQDYGYEAGIRLTRACFVSPPLSATAADAQQALGRLRD